jgi:hypothetical protein
MYYSCLIYIVSFGFERTSYASFQHNSTVGSSTVGQMALGQEDSCIKYTIPNQFSGGIQRGL